LAPAIPATISSSSASGAAAVRSWLNRRHYITIAEAAEHLQISDRTVRRLIRDSALNGYRMGSALVSSGSTSTRSTFS